MVNNLTFDVAVNTRWPGEKLGLPPSERRWARYNNNFETKGHNPASLLEQIRRGYSFAPILDGCSGTCCGAWCTKTDHKAISGHCGRPRGYRRNQHFRSAHFIALDFDTGDKRSSIKYLNQQPLIAKYGTFLYTTLSHTPVSPKARAVFIMDSAITNPDLYRRFKVALMSQLPWGDASVHDPSRMFYGSHPWWGRSQFLGNFLPVTVVEGLVREHCSQIEAEQAPRTRSRITSCRVFGTSPEDHYINTAIHQEVVSLSSKAEGTSGTKGCSSHRWIQVQRILLVEERWRLSRFRRDQAGAAALEHIRYPMP